MSKANEPVSVSILGKEYRIGCEPGEEDDRLDGVGPDHRDVAPDDHVHPEGRGQGRLGRDRVQAPDVGEVVAAPEDVCAQPPDRSQQDEHRHEYD